MKEITTTVDEGYTCQIFITLLSWEDQYLPFSNEFRDAYDSSIKDVVSFFILKL